MDAGRAVSDEGFRRPARERSPGCAQDLVTGATAVVEVLIDLRIEQAWHRVTDVTRIGEWSPSGASARWLGGATGARVGVRFGLSDRRCGGAHPALCVVLEVRPPERFGYAVLDGAADVARPAATSRYELAPAGVRGRTLVRQTVVHGPGHSALRAHVLHDPAHAQRLVEEGLEQLRAAMVGSLHAMATR
jgi:uncharacterized protein YndB with AHSA1/START domain